MFGKCGLLNVVVSLVLFGFATGIVAGQDTGTKTVYIRGSDFLNQGHQYSSMYVVDDTRKELRVDRPLLAEIISSALKNHYGESIDGVDSVYFIRTHARTDSDGNVVYWNRGRYYRTRNGLEYVKIPVRLDLEIGEEIVRKILCQWEVYFQADERWKNISVNTMQMSSCRHPEINFTSNVFVDILSNRLDSVFVSQE